MQKQTAVLSPNLGLYYNRSPLLVPKRGLVDGLNFRIKDGKLNNYNLGWTKFGTWTLNGKRVMKIFTHTDRSNGDTLFFANPTDIFKYSTAAGGSVSYMTPRYQTGTVSRAATGIITGVGTLFLANVKIGDEIHFGAIDFTDPTSTWDVITAVTDNTHITTSGALSVVGATVYTIRKLYITGLGDQWQFATFLRDATSGKDILFATNYVDWVQTWSFGDTQMTSQSALGFKCVALLPFSNMMMYGNINDATALKPTSIINSDVSKPLAAGSLGTGLSEEFVVHDGVDEIHSFGHLANSLVIYSKMHTVAAQFVGDPEVFAFRKVSRDLGPTGPFAWADFGDYHEFLGADGAYRFDGVGVTEIHPHVMRFVRAGTDPKRLEFVYTHFIDIESEVIWSVPLTTDAGAGTLGTAPEFAWTEHYLEDVGPQVPRPFSKRQFPFTATGYWTNAASIIWSDLTLTWADYAARWSELSSAASVQQLAGDASGQIWIINTTQLANGVGLPSYVQFPRFATGDMHEKNRLQRIYPYFSQGTGNITVTTFYSNFATGTMSSDAGLSFDTSLTGNDFVSPMVKGRFGAAQFGATNGIAYQLEGYNYEIAKLVGGRR